MIVHRRWLAALAVAVCALFALVLTPAARAQTASIDQFLQAAALQPGDVPAGLQIIQQMPVAPATFGQLAGMDRQAAAGFSGVLGGYTQALVAEDLSGVLFGSPAAAGDLLLAFDTPDDARTVHTALARQLPVLLPQLLGRAQFGITIQQSAALPAPAIGDEAQETELNGTLGMGGQSVSLVIDVVVARRGQVEFLTFAVGLQGQSSTAEALAAAIDRNIQASLGLLSGN